jgi:pimeloyl-ACP methyl ester carboxylesterase
MARPSTAERPTARRALLALLLLPGALACSLALPKPAVPLRTIELGPRTGGTCLTVLLPGRFAEPETFRRTGWAEAVARRELKLDLIAVDSHLGYFRDRSLVERLRIDVIGPARAAGYRSIWVVGTSLGGLGGLLYLRDHPGDLSGVFAIAPYLGEPEVIREIAAAGGPAHWPPPNPPADDHVGRELWSWLGPWALGPQSTPLHLGWGTEDSLAAANRMLATLLPRERVYTAKGGHDWKTWTRLWEQFLDRTAPCRAEP